MTNALRFFVPGQPQAWQRAGVSNGRHYTKKETAGYEQTVAWSAKAAMGASDPISGAVSVQMWFVYAIPASWSKKRVKARLFGPKVSRPDADNLAKAVLDAMNGIVYTDDAQVWDCRVVKTYGEIEGVTVEVTA